MALESASFISGLVAANPPGTDAISQGDDHLRLIKTVLKASLPNADAAINGIHTKATAPSSTSAGQLWFDTTNNLLNMRNEADDGWVNLAASEAGGVLATTHARLTGNASVRSATYADTGLAFSHTKLTASSDLYVNVNIFQNTYSNFSTSTHDYVYAILTDSSGTLIVDTNNDQIIMIMEDVGQGTGTTWDLGAGWSWMYKVTNANCPTPGAGAQSFKMYTKCTNPGDMDSQFNLGCTVMVWEIAT